MRVKNGVLSWPIESRVLRRHDDPAGDYWRAFLRLGDLEGGDLSRSVAAIARRWGPLHLCAQHGLPTTHPPEVAPGHLPSTSLVRGCPPAVVEERFVEPVDRWRELARQAGAILMARADIKDGAVVPASRFAAMTGALPLGMAGPGTDPISLSSLGFKPVEGPFGHGEIGPIILRTRLSKEAAIGLAVRQWLAMSDVSPRFRWEGTDFALSFQSGSFFGALALRLAGSLTHAQPLVKCAFGNHWYVQKRRNTYFCREPACDRLRKNENARRSRSGGARHYEAQSTGTAS
jgi:hypothetical protein